MPSNSHRNPTNLSSSATNDEPPPAADSTAPKPGKDPRAIELDQPVCHDGDLNAAPKRDGTREWKGTAPHR